MAWTTCTEGHDLTVEDAYVFIQGNNRMCRVCHRARLKKKPTPKVRFLPA
jgi:hypothetical protein